MSDIISIGCTHEVEVGKRREKAWPKAEVTIEALPGESFEDHLARANALYRQAIQSSIDAAVQRIMDN